MKKLKCYEASSSAVQFFRVKVLQTIFELQESMTLSEIAFADFPVVQQRSLYWHQQFSLISASSWKQVLKVLDKKQFKVLLFALIYYFALMNGRDSIPTINLNLFAATPGTV